MVEDGFIKNLRLALGVAIADLEKLRKSSRNDGFGMMIDAARMTAKVEVLGTIIRAYQDALSTSSEAKPNGSPP